MTVQITRMDEEVPQEQHNRDRLRRAESWYQRSREVETRTEKFMFLWIAFNAAYGFRMPFSQQDRRETQKFNNFLRKIEYLDTDETIYGILNNDCHELINELLRNQYTFEPFWKAVSGLSDSTDWEEEFESSKERAFRAFRNRDTPALLEVVFERLYAVRNQLLHGGATFETGWGMDQVSDGCEIMSALVPEIIRFMQADMENEPSSTAWGRVAYPRINFGPD